MAYEDKQVPAGVTRIMWIPTHALRYKQMQPMAYRNSQMQAGATRIMWILVHASMCNQWYIETVKCKLVQLE